MPSLMPLLGLLSPSIHVTNNVLVLSSDIFEEPRARFLYYARRICIISSIESLSFHRSSLYCGNTGRRLGRIISVGDPDGEHGSPLRDLVNTLGSAAPSLQRLALSGNMHPLAVLSVSELQDLRAFQFINRSVVDIGTWFPPVLQSCAALEMLQDLALTVQETRNRDAPTFSGFRRLRSLLAQGRITVISRFCETILSTQLLSVTAFVSRPDSWREYRAYFETLSARFGRSLRAVHISGTWVGDVSSRTRPLEMIRPLMGLHELEEVCVISGTGIGLSLTNSDVLELAKCWPSLTEFKLLYQAIPATLPASSLVAFAQHCPHLHTLWLASIDLKNLGRECSDAYPASHHGLRSIWLVGHIPSDGREKLAQLIDHIFPSVNSAPMKLDWHPSSDEAGWCDICTFTYLLPPSHNWVVRKFVTHALYLS
ncbi:hypothetical protein A0H81_14258 [Grifola frondosa]|uniref:F-box domain-containing protein n=1 Tax=Grifola frondosa TaxID=5627 RepID=A0A1C7LLP2_GRIFR|nr:hypothetical protein A0H81_14258 [Grifola frondosa]